MSKKKLKQLFFRGLLGILAVIILTFGGVVVFFSLPPGENILRLQLESILSRALVQEVEIQGLETNLVTRLQLFHVRVVPVDAMVAPSTLSLDYGRIDFRLWHLISKPLHIRSLEVDGFNLAVHRDTTGVYDLPLFTRDSTAESGMRVAGGVRIDQLTVRNTSLAYSDLSLAVEGGLRDMQIDLAMRADTISFALSANAATLNIGAYPFSFSGLTLEGRFQQQLLEVSQLAGHVLDYTLQGGLQLDFSTPGTALAGHIDLSGEFQSVVDFFDWGVPEPFVPINGLIELQCKLMGTLTEYSILLDARFPRLSSAGVTLSEGTAHGIYDGDTLKVHDLVVDINQGNARAKGWVIPEGNFPYFIDLHTRNLDPNGLWQPIFQYFQWPMPDQLQPVRGIIRFDSQWSGSYDEMRIRFTAELPSLQAAELLLVDNFLEGSFHSDTLSLDRVSLGFGEGSMRGSGWLQAGAPYAHHLRLDAENLQPDYILPTVTGLFQWQPPGHLSPITGTMDLECELAGSIQDPGITLAARIPSLRLPGFTIHESSLSGAYRSHTLEIFELDLNAGAGSARGAGWLTLTDPFPHEVSLLLTDLDLKQLWELAYGPSSPFSGRMEAVIESQGSIRDLGQLQMQSHLELSRVTFQDRPVPEFNLRGTVEQGAARISLLQGETKIDFTGRALGEEQIQGELNASIPSVEVLLQLFHVSGIEGAVTLNGNVSGTLVNPRITADFSTEDFQVYRLPLDTCRGSLSYADSQLTFSRGLVSSSFARLEDLAPPLQIAGLTGQLAFRGQFDGSLTEPRAMLMVNLHHPGYHAIRLDHSLAVLQLDQGLLTIDTLALWKDSLLCVSQGSLSLIDTTGSLRTAWYRIRPSELSQTIGQLIPRDSFPLGDVLVTLQRDQTSQWRLGARSSGFDLQGIAGALGHSIPVVGELDFNLTADDILDTPSALLEWNIRGPVYTTFSADSLRGRIRVNSSLITCESLEIFQGADQPRIALSGRLPFESPGRFTVGRDQPINGRMNLHELDLKWLKTLLADDQDLSGNVTGRLNLAGTLKHPELQGALELQHGALRLGANVQPVRSLTALIAIDNSLLTIQSLAGIIQEVPFHLTGSTQLAQFPAIGLDLELSVAQIATAMVNGSVSEESVDLNLFAQNLDLALVHSFLPELHSLQGILSSRVSVKGATWKPHLNGFVQLVDARFQLSPEAIPMEQLAFQLTLADSLLTIGDLTANVQGIPLLLSGEIFTRRWTSFRTDLRLLANSQEVMSARGSFAPDTMAMILVLENMNLALAQPFIRTVSGLNGSAAASLDLSGRPDDPSFQGSLAIRDGSFRTLPGNLDVSRGHLVLNFENKRVRIDSLEAAISENGRVNANGTLDVIHGQPVNMNITLKASNIQYAQPRVYSLNLRSALITLTERDQTYFVDGDLAFGDSRYRKSFQIKDIVAFFNSIDRPRPELPGPLRRTRLNLRVRNSQQLWVDNNLARIRVRTDLTLLGSLSDPVLAGRITALEGYAYYLDRRFTIKEGVLNFADPVRIRPEVRLVAESLVKSYQTPVPTTYTITLMISGPVDRATVDLTSTPPLDQVDIIAMLTVGATRDQLLSQQMTGTLQDRLTGLSSDRIARYTSQKLGDLLDLDNVSIEGNLFRFNRSWGPQLIASRKVSDRMDITYQTTIGQFNEQGVRLDYTISKNFLLEGSTNNRGQTGLDLKFRIRFK
ncbi:translocation/assembly module TamB domain-containing protein [Candidatus Neomarinimicrobiota bacterium]